MTVTTCLMTAYTYLFDFLLSVLEVRLELSFAVGEGCLLGGGTGGRLRPGRGGGLLLLDGGGLLLDGGGGGPVGAKQSPTFTTKISQFGQQFYFS